MVNIVTGYVGKPHIQAAEQGLFNGGVCGNKIVLPTNQQFSYILNSNNSITIQSGDLVNQGRHITIPFNSSETLTIDNGKAGYNRIDTVVMRYERDSSTSVESAKLLIIKGTPSTTAAIAPEVISGNIYGGAIKDDFPLYNINITDLSVTSVSQLFYVTTPLDSLSKRSKEQERLLNNISNTNRLLYQGEGLFMHELQKITLSEKISEQPSGIILVWSVYNSSQTQNYHYCFNFIPKYVLSLPKESDSANGVDIDLFLCAGGVGGGYAGVKCLSITDDVIYGNAGNDDIKNIQGIECRNNTWVLRAVIGV